MSYATVAMTSTWNWFVSILVEDGAATPKPAPFTSDTTIGVDVGLTDFAPFSAGEKGESPRHLRKSLERLKVLQRRVSRKVKGSKNREISIQ